MLVLLVNTFDDENQAGFPDGNKAPTEAQIGSTGSNQGPKKFGEAHERGESGDAPRRDGAGTPMSPICPVHD